MDYEDYKNDNFNELAERFAELKKNSEKFAEFCMEEYEENIRDNADYMSDMERDRRLEADEDARQEAKGVE